MTTLRQHWIRGGVFSTLLLVGGWISTPDPTVYLIGDSTVADKPLTGSPERGWGQVLPLFLRNGIVVENHAKNGRSTKSFIREGRWEAVRAKLHSGDYVLIQFGHNDAKKEDTSRFADAHADYRANLMKFVRETRVCGAVPILITPVVRRRFDEQGRFYDVHGDYPEVVREIGVEVGVPVIDLHRKSFDLLARLGPVESRKLFLSAGPGEYSALPNGKEDNTHFCWYGASEMARLVVEGIRGLELPLTEALNPVPPDAFVGLNKLVLLDCFYNNEWKKDSAGNVVRFHYTWDDSTNSGYSILAMVVSRLGCSMDTLPSVPTVDALRHASIYVIVDPDTRKETQNPHYIDTNAIDAVVAWVRQGGVLVLMGNDQGNAEFEHMNQLAGRFGIRFNEDSRNRVTKNQFEVGTFEKFPHHPLFDGVRKIFIKELSTLQLQEPAHAVFSEGGDVIMAYSQVEKGSVFAVGDPWFYNEYMDSRRLPEGYDNARAAENLFRWLLQQSSQQ